MDSDEEQEVFGFDDYVTIDVEGQDREIRPIDDITIYYEERPDEIPDDIKKQVEDLLTEKDAEDVHPIMSSYKDFQRTGYMRDVALKFKLRDSGNQNEELIRKIIPDGDLSKYQYKIHGLNNNVLTDAVNKMKNQYAGPITYDELRYMLFIGALQRELQQ